MNGGKSTKISSPLNAVLLDEVVGFALEIEIPYGG
jgi:hypothetical protein